MEKLSETLKVSLGRAKQDLEDGYKLYEDSTKFLQKNLKEIETKLAKLRDELIQPKLNVVDIAEKAMWKAQSTERKAEGLDMLYGQQTFERMVILGKHMRSFWGKPKVRAIRNDRRLTTMTYGFTQEGGDETWYLAFVCGMLISALHVRKAQHRGDTTYTTAYGVTEVKKPNSGYSRRGYSMREWMNPDYVQYRGLTAEEKVTLEGKLFR